MKYKMKCEKGGEFFTEEVSSTVLSGQAVYDAFSTAYDAIGVDLLGVTGVEESEGQFWSSLV